MVTTLGTRATEPVGVDDKDQEIQLLKAEANLYQVSPIIIVYIYYQECIRGSTELYTHNINHVVM